MLLLTVFALEPSADELQICEKQIRGVNILSTMYGMLCDTACCALQCAVPAGLTLDLLPADPCATPQDRQTSAIRASLFYYEDRPEFQKVGTPTLVL